MDFTTIGTLGSFIKQKNLTFAANYKIKTGQRIADANGNLLSTKSSMFEALNKANKKSTDQLKQQRVSSIKNKLMSGQKISDVELNYLKENDPSLYRKAKHADDAREELKADLRKAKTKQEARQAVTQAMMKASAEAAAELAAYKNGMAAGGAVPSGANVGGDVSVGNVVPSAEPENISAENVASQSLADVNAEVEQVGEEMTSATNEVIKIELAEAQTAENVHGENISEPAEENQPTTENISDNKKTSSNNSQNISQSDSSEKTTADDILEKFIMTIRALENEWAKFAKSDEYKDLPEDIFDDNENKLAEPNNKVTKIISAYRKSMNYA